MKRVLAIDPGLTRCGVAVLQFKGGRTVELIFAGTIRSDSDLELGARLQTIETEISQVLAEYAPNCVAIEQVFSQHNVMTVIGTAQAAGVAALVASKHRLEVSFYTPSEVKAAVSGNGQANKAQVATMVSRIVGHELPGPADLTDAVALGVCHLWRSVGTSHVGTSHAGTSHAGTSHVGSRALGDKAVGERVGEVQAIATKRVGTERSAS